MTATAILAPDAETRVGIFTDTQAIPASRSRARMPWPRHHGIKLILEARKRRVSAVGPHHARRHSLSRGAPKLNAHAASRDTGRTSRPRAS